jgi:hypothetical protein
MGEEGGREGDPTLRSFASLQDDKGRVEEGGRENSIHHFKVDGLLRFYSYNLVFTNLVYILFVLYVL